MKWYSVKKHKPPSFWTHCVVYANNNLYIAYYFDGTWCDEEDGALENVSHFAIPDPIEIEE